MSNFLRKYLKINIIFGLINISYNFETNNFNLYHRPTLIYCGIFNLAIFIVIQYNFYIFFKTEGYKYIAHLGSQIAFILTTYMGQCFVTVVYLVMIWLKRKSIFELFNKWRYLNKYYNTLKSDNENQKFDINTRHLCVIKILAVSFHLSAFIAQIPYIIISIKGCSYENCCFWETTKYIFVIYMDLCIIINEINLYLLLIFIFMCYQMLEIRLKKIKTDIKIMYKLHGNDFYSLSEWLKLLKLNILKISKFDIQLNEFLKEFFYIFQFQIILLLFIMFMSLLHMFYNIFFAFVIPLHLGTSLLHPIMIYLLIYNISLIIAKLLQIILFFNIFQKLKKSLKEINYLTFEIINYAFLETKDMFEGNYIQLNVSVTILFYLCTELEQN